MRIGLHTRNDTRFTETDWRLLEVVRPDALFIMSFTDSDTVKRLRATYPDMQIIVRLYHDFKRGNVPVPVEWATRVQFDILRLGDFGIKDFQVLNEPNHLEGIEGWGQTEQDARDFQGWYLRALPLLRQVAPWARFGYPGLAIPHNDLDWLEWTREAVEASDWLGVHIYWQTPPDQPATHLQDFWGGRFKAYHAKFPHKQIHITEFGNSNGQSGLPLSRDDQARQYTEWLRMAGQHPYIASAHSFIATSPDPRWQNEGFTWAGEDGTIYPVAYAVGALPRVTEEAKPVRKYKTQHNFMRLNGPPFVSQQGPAASRGIYDCGIACACSLIRSKPGRKFKGLTVDQLGQAAGIVTKYQGASTYQIQQAANLYGVSLVWDGGHSPANTVQRLVEEVEAGRASVLLLAKLGRMGKYNHFLIGPHGYEWDGDTLYFFVDDVEEADPAKGENQRIMADELVSMMTKAVARTPRQMLLLRSHKIPVWRKG